MRRRVKARITGADCVAAAATDVTSKRADQRGAEAPFTGLVALAEELGRLPARRELAKTRDRRAYALPELLLGAFITAFVWVLIARALGWLVP